MDCYDDTVISDNPKNIYLTLTCRKCKGKLNIEVYMSPGFSDYQIVVCPSCGADIQKIRADRGYKVTNFIPAK